MAGTRSIKYTVFNRANVKLGEVGLILGSTLYDGEPLSWFVSETADWRGISNHGYYIGGTIKMALAKLLEYHVSHVS